MPGLQLEAWEPGLAARQPAAVVVRVLRLPAAPVVRLLAAVVARRAAVLQL